jgi:16S rRNA (cytosine967-C5)-methyltransferase
MPGGAYRLVHSGDVRTLFGFEQGFWWVQDAASRLAITLSGNVFGKDVIDLCAAPGGKTFYLVCNGANVTAVDRSEKRIKRLDENLKRLGMKADTVCADSLTWLPKKRADLVLLDAPCSGTGTLRRNPDIAYLKSPQDLKRLVTLQTKLFDAAAKMIKPEGRILFCTCSLQPEEGPEQVRMFLERHPEFKLDRVSANEVFVNTNPSGIFRSFPYDLPEHGGRDGFFAARLCR